MELERRKNRDIRRGVKNETEVQLERVRELQGRMKGHKKTGSDHCTAFPWRQVSGVGEKVLCLARRKVAFWNECEFPQGR